MLMKQVLKKVAQSLLLSSLQNAHEAQALGGAK